MLNELIKIKKLRQAMFLDLSAELHIWDCDALEPRYYGIRTPNRGPCKHIILLSYIIVVRLIDCFRV